MKTQGVTECVSPVSHITFGKTNQQGKIKHSFAVRHCQVEICSVGALVTTTFFSKCYYENEPFRDLTSRDR